MAVASIIWIPIVAAYRIYEEEGSLVEVYFFHYVLSSKGVCFFIHELSSCGVFLHIRETTFVKTYFNHYIVCQYVYPRHLLPLTLLIYVMQLPSQALNMDQAIRSLKDFIIETK
jgi:hypothetical protein